MARTQSKSGLIITIVVLVVMLLAVGAIAFFQNANKSKSAPITNTSQEQPETTKDATSTETDDTDATPPPATGTPAVDPETLSSIDIEPLGISVFYTKGIPGFDFAVKRTADKTQYVEFSSSEVVGTKCTNDEGLIVTIIKNPTSNEEQATVTQTVKVGSDTYGLSLAGKGCTSNAELLNEYQTAFTNGFSRLSSL